MSDRARDMMDAILNLLDRADLVTNEPLVPAPADGREIVIIEDHRGERYELEVRAL